jgi:type VI protein secretion system component VasF
MQDSGSSDGAAALAPSRRRRWWMLGTIGVLLLVLYVVALAWVTQRLQTDVENSIHPVQALQAGPPGG